MIGKFINFFSGSKYPSKIPLDKGRGINTMGKSERSLYDQFSGSVKDALVDFFDKYDVSDIIIMESLKYPVIPCAMVMGDLYTKDDITEIVENELYPIINFIGSINGCGLTSPYFGSRQNAIFSYMTKEVFRPHFYIGKNVCVYEHYTDNASIVTSIMFTFENPHYKQFSYSGK